MKFEYLFEELLLELSSDEIYEKYYKDITYDIFYEISMADPKTVEKDGKITKMGKYSKLLLDLYKKKLLDIEDLSNAKEYLEQIYKHNVPVDIKNIRGIPDLYNLVKSYIVSKTKTIDEILKSLDSTEYEVLLDGKEWAIFKPLTEKAACYIGVGSSWCTTWGEQSLNKEYRDRSNRFESYASQGTIYTIINKKLNNQKYQFHFPTKQFMNSDNRRIDTKVFFSQAPEVKYFFFPSLNRDVSFEEIKKELTRISILDKNDQKIILDKLKDLNQGNDLISIIINNDNEAMIKLMGGSDSDPDITDEHIKFSIKNLGRELQDIYDTLGNYSYDYDSPSERLYDDIDNTFDNETWENTLGDTFDDFFTQNRDEISINLGIKDYSQFKSFYFDDFINDGSIRQAATDTMIDNTIDQFRNGVKEAINEINNYIDIERSYGSLHQLVFVKDKFLAFLVAKDISIIIDDENNINDITSEYIDYYNIPTEYEPFYDYSFSLKYEKDGDDSFSKKVDEYFGSIKEADPSCTEAKKKLYDIINKHFDGRLEFENDDVLVRINSAVVDCKNQSVDVTFKNKKTNKLSRGSVKVDNIMNYITNYPIFENYFLFKKLIK